MKPNPSGHEKKLAYVLVALCLLVFGCAKDEDEKLPRPYYSQGLLQNEAIETEDENVNDGNDYTIAHDYELARVVDLSNLVYQGPQPNSCKASDLSLVLPIAGTQSTHWGISHYQDLDRTRDNFYEYSGHGGSNARTKDQHYGTWFQVPTYRTVDAGLNVYAAASGVVTHIEENHSWDRNNGSARGGILCGLYENVVYIRHFNGFRSFYGSLKKGSVIVQVGQTVSRGQKIAEVAGSGCKTRPGLHFRMADCENKMLDPFAQGMFPSNVVPYYETDINIMDVVYKNGAFSSMDQVVDPPANPSNLVIPPYGTLGIGVILGGGHKNDVFRIEIYTPNESRYYYSSESVMNNLTTYRFEKTSGLKRFRTNIPITSLTMGTWRIEYKVNNIRIKTKTFKVGG